MEMRVRMSRLAWVGSLVVVVASCGSPDEQTEASEAAASGTSTTAGHPAPQSSRTVPQETTRQTHRTQTQLPGPEPPKPQPPAPQPPKPQPPDPQPQPPAPEPQPPPAPNPNPPPGTVSYDLPDVGGSDLADEDNWRSGYENNCTTAGHPPDCLHLTVEAYAADANGGSTRIDDPGPHYFSDNVYESCPVTAITPEPPAEVPVGTTVVIRVLCQPVGGGGD